MAVNQKQIAEKLGVSIALVSRVLSGKAVEIGIAPSTIQKVLKTTEEMGYVPSAAALSLKGKATRTIGVVVYDFKDPFFGAIIEQLQIQAHEYNYSLVLAGFIDRIPQEQALQPLYKHTIDGLIVIGTDLDARWLKKFRHIPVARIGHGSESEQSVRISIDEEAAAGLLMDHLKKTGRKNLVYICADLPAHRLRRDIFENVAKTRSLVLKTEMPAERMSFAAGAQAVRQIIQSKAATDALVCATDQVAMGALNTLRNVGIVVPDRIAVTGFDGIAVGQQFIPAITTIQQPVNEITAHAFQAIINAPDPQRVNLPGVLVARETA
jgi:LacI family transcriptional regulator